MKKAFGARKSGFAARAAVVALVTALCVGAAAAGYLSRTAAVSAKKRDLPIYCVGRDDGAIALSFDAAWGADNTQKILDVLDEYGVKTTFFVVGRWAEEYPDTVRAIAAAGHEVMNHSQTHPQMSGLGRAEMLRELDRCSDGIEALTGARPGLFRAPFGDYSDAVVAAARERGMTAVQWDVDSLDWKDLPADEIWARVTGKVKSGSIVLFHNAGLHTPEALPRVLETLIREKGYKVVPVSELLLQGSYTVDHTGRQIAGGAR